MTRPGQLIEEYYDEEIRKASAADLKTERMMAIVKSKAGWVQMRKDREAYNYVLNKQPMKVWKDLAKNSPSPGVRKAAGQLLKEIPWWFCCMRCF
jgi:hypothetical protein